MLINKKLLLFFLLLLNFHVLLANRNYNINILTWEGIFDASDKIKEKLDNISSVCNVDISFDNYSNHTDFLNQLSTHHYNYNIVIAPNTFLNLITEDIPLNQNKQIENVHTNYNSYIKKHYKNVKLPPNVVYFLQSMTGILINRELIKNTQIINIYDLLNSIDNQKMLLILDDPIELSFIMEMSEKRNRYVNTTYKKIINNINKFDKLSSNKNITVVNFYNERMKQANFAASISWSGDAIRDMLLLNTDLKVKYSFETPPAISFISTDLLIQFKRNKKTDCVTKMIASKNFIDSVAYETNYFSPFINNKIKAKNAVHYDIQKKYLAYLKNAHWLDAVSNDGFDEVHYEWEKFKFNAIKNKNKKYINKH